MQKDNAILLEQIEEINDTTNEFTEDKNLEKNEVKSEEIHKKNKKTKAKKETKKKAKKVDTDSDTKDKSKTKNEEYYIKVQYKDNLSNTDYIKITAEDKTNFKDSKEMYHKVKDIYKNEASKISLVGISKGKEMNILHSKNIEQKDINKDIQANLQQIANLKSEIINQVNDIEKEITNLNEQKDTIEAIIKNSNYNVLDKIDSVPNELIRLKYILIRIEEYKNLANHLKPLIQNGTLFDEAEIIKTEQYA